MRRGLKPKFLFENESLIGVSLSADYAAEHECGISELRKKLGLYERVTSKNFLNSISGPPKFGESTFRPTNVESVKWFKIMQYSGFTTTEIRSHDWDGKKLTARESITYLGLGYYPSTKTKTSDSDSKTVERPTLQSAWDEGDFVVASDDKEEIKKLSEIYSELKKGNAYIGIFGGRAFQNGGLTVLVADRVPQDTKDEWYTSDKNRYDSLEWLKNTGIEERLTRAGRRWYALYPSDKKEDGNYLVWLNPQEQNKYTYGWMSLQDLEDWVDDKGRVIRDHSKTA